MAELGPTTAEHRKNFIANCAAQECLTASEYFALRLIADVKRRGDALDELLEVSKLRGDRPLPAPEDDPVLWTARMQTAWDDAEAVLDA